MPEFHAEPYVYLAGLSHKSALIAWGAFYFRTRSDGRTKLVDDADLQWVHPPRCDSIGCRSKPYGPAEVEVRDEAGAIVAFVSGVGSKIRSGAPSRMDEAHTVSWAPACHFLLGTIDGAAMTVRAIGEQTGDQLEDIERFDRDGNRGSGRIVIPAQR